MLNPRFNIKIDLDFYSIFDHHHAFCIKIFLMGFICHDFVTRGVTKSVFWLDPTPTKDPFPFSAGTHDRALTCKHPSPSLVPKFLE